MKKDNTLIFGTFDVLHPGHIFLINYAAKYGKVNVVLTPDELCKKYKGVDVVSEFNARKQRLEKLEAVEKVISADTEPNSYTVLKKIKPSIIILGHDQQSLKQNIKQKLAQFGITAKIIFAPSYRSNLYKSSKLKSLVINT